jgi:AcrR family transcriptional regulator
MSQVDLRAKILEEAIGIVYREGVDRITMRSLARKLGYSPAAIYLHFRSKAELEYEIGFHGFEVLWRELSPAFSREDAEEALAELMRRYIEFGISNPQLYRLMFQDMTRLREGEFANDPRVARVRHGVISIYRRGLEGGAFRSCDPELETAVGWAGLHGFVLLTIQGVFPSEGLSSDPVPVRELLVQQRVRALRP